MSQSETYRRILAKGRCSHCSNPRVEGRTQCAAHLAERNKAQTEGTRRQRAAGLCGVVGCPVESPDFYFCLRHRLLQQDQRRIRREGEDTAPVVIPTDPPGMGDSDPARYVVGA